MLGEHPTFLKSKLSLRHVHKHNANTVTRLSDVSWWNAFQLWFSAIQKHTIYNLEACHTYVYFGPMEQIFMNAVEVLNWFWYSMY